MSNAATSIVVRVLAHTHWDREWYLPAGRFRQRLVALVDELLDGAAAGGGFLLDGQAIVLDDYLAVRPQRAARLRDALADGTLEAGPWYVLADELIPSGEALVRNLLAGRRALHSLGAEPPPVLYCPDAFGHPAALPALARGFGATVVVLWRGYGGARWPAGDTVRWRAPGGATCVLFHLPPDGYEFGSNLPDEDSRAAERWARLRVVLESRSRLGVLLVQNGADHHALQPRFHAALTALERAAAPLPVERTTLGAFARELDERAEGATLPEVAGELRDSYGYAWTLQGTFGTRAAQKRANAQVERLLVRDAEPWAALAARRSGRSARPLIDAAWRTLLRCHPHDTLCGCSIDAVARAMDVRLDDARAQGLGVREDAVLALIGHDTVAARTGRERWQRVALIRNRAARPRAGVAEIDLMTFLADVPVGPGAATVRPAAARVRGAPVALDGGRVPLQVLDRLVRHDRIESPRHYPDDDLVESARVVAWVGDVPAYGITPLTVTGAVPPDESPRLPPSVRVEGAVLDNGIVRVAIDQRGRIRLTSERAGFDVDDLVRFEDVGDAGDLYTHSPVGRTIEGGWFGGARVLHRGPLRGAIEARWKLRVPVARGRAPDDEREPAPVRGGRAPEHVELALRLTITLDAASPFVRFRVTGDNRARDHRLRVRFATGITSPVVHADAAFGPVVREPTVVSAEERATEAPPPTAPMHRYVSLTSSSRGATLYADGLAEYEAAADGTIAVTLVRAVGELSRNDLPERLGHAGWPAATPGAQMQGPFAAEFALMPHGARDDAVVDSIERAADDVLLPLTGTTLRSALAIPATVDGVALEGAGLALSAIKESEDGDWLVLRCVNLLEREVAGRWLLSFDARQAQRARLDETAERPLAIDGRAIAFTAGARGVVTVLVR